MAILTLTAPRLPAPLRAREAAPPIGAVTASADVGETATSALLGIMGRRIPPAYPEISEEKIRDLCAKIKPGDVILTADLAYPGWARMEYWTVRSNHTHAAFVGNDGQVYEAVGRGVLKGKLEDFFEGRIKVAVARLGLDDGAVARATEYCQKQVGKPYDDAFDTADDSEFYCSELVAKAVEHGNPSLRAPRHTLLGREAIAPDAFLHIPGAERVHDDGSDYWKNKLAYWPLGSSALAGGVTGAMVGGVGGAVVGGLVGFVGSVLVGNKLQTGYALPSLHQKIERKHRTPGEQAPPAPATSPELPAPAAPATPAPSGAVASTAPAPLPPASDPSAAPASAA